MSMSMMMHCSIYYKLKYIRIASDRLTICVPSHRLVPLSHHYPLGTSSEGHSVLLTSSSQVELPRSSRQLSSNSSRNCQTGMNIGKESRRILLDTCQFETGTSIHSVGEDSGLEGACQAADAVPDIFVTGQRLRVGECDSRWPGGTASSLVDVGRCGCWRLIFSAESVEGYVVANGIGLRVYAKVVCPGSAG